MSASETDVEKQKKRHRGPLVGIAFALLWAGVLFGGLMIWLAYQNDNPDAESPAEVVSE